MRVSITGRHMEVTDAIKEYVEKGLEKVRGHFDKVIDVDVILSVEKKRRHIAEFNLHANGLRINAKESSGDMYASVDAALNKVDRQVLKHKSRIRRHQPRTAREARNYEHQVFELEPAEQDNGRDMGEAAEPRHRVLFREKVPIKPMDMYEAALQLDLIEDPFFVFSNASTMQVNVIYSRGDGSYGLIEPELQPDRSASGGKG